MEELKKKVEEQEKTIEELKGKLERSENRMKEVIRLLEESRMEIFRINDSELKIDDSKDGFIGSGSFGTVRHCKWISERDVAVKNVELNKVEKKEDIISEFQSQVGLAHPNVLRVYGYSEPYNSQIMRIVMEKMDMSLVGFALSKPLLCDKIRIMKEMLKSVHFLHTKQPMVIHRDIKGSNFLISKDGQNLKICDFGLSTTKTSSVIFYKTKGNMKGTAQYMSPEIIDKEYSVHSDIYALGVTFWEFLYVKQPYFKIPHYRVAFKTASGLRPKFEPALPEGIELLQKIIEKMWAHDATDRPLTKQLLKEFMLNEEVWMKCAGNSRFPFGDDDDEEEEEEEENEGEK